MVIEWIYHKFAGIPRAKYSRPHFNSKLSFKEIPNREIDTILKIIFPYRKQILD